VTVSKYVVFQPAASTPVRSLPGEVVQNVLEACRELGLVVLAPHHQDFESEIEDLFQRLKVISLVGLLPDFACFASIIQGATCLIGSDSSGLHVAAALNVRAVGIFGNFSLKSRAMYYPLQVDIFDPELCPHSPCMRHHMPTHLCPRGIEQKAHGCEVFYGANKKRILDQIEHEC
jgi:ADP-heptose:LPS heptosyltransferase